MTVTDQPRQRTVSRGVRASSLCLLLMLAAALAVLAPPAGSRASAVKLGSPEPQTPVKGYGELPLAFEPNRGQADARTAFVARGAGYTIGLRATEALFALGGRDRLRLRLAGASHHATFAPEQRLPGKVNYLLGNDRSRWLTGLPTYARIMARNVYPGIDLAYYGQQGTLEYDFILRPGTDPSLISLGFEGAGSLEIDGSGSLVIKLSGGTLRQPAPRVYQEIDGLRHEVDGSFALRGKRVGFELGPYDRTRALVIDPQLLYSTYLGGSGNDRAYAVTVDGAGAAYVTGYTDSPNFPTVGPYQGDAGSTDAFVTKLSPAGNGFVYSTYLGGGGVEEGLSIAVDSSGAAYVTGHTISTDFPLANAIQSVQRGSYDLFVTKLVPSGSGLAYSTYLGGTGWDVFSQIAVDSSGSAYVVGETESTDFPILNAYQSTHGVTQPGGFGSDAFLTKLNPAGTALVYSTFLGGNNIDAANGIAVDSTGAAYVSGAVRSLNFPTLNPYQATKAGNAGQYDAFVTKFTPAGNALVYSTYLGGATSDGNPRIAVDSAGSAYVSGSTTSPDFPTVNAYQANHGGIMDIYVTKFTPAGNALVYSTHLGGSGFDVAAGLAVDAAGSAYVGGYSDSPNYPTAGPCPRTSSGGQDAVVTKLSPTGTSLNYSTYMGGTNDEFAFGFATDGSGATYITGSTNSTNLPLLNPAQASLAGAIDVFVTKQGDSPANTVCLRALEVNQAIQTWRNMIQLVKDKDTGVRAFVETAVAGAPNQNVVGVLHGTRNGNPLPGSPLTAVNAGGSVNVQPNIVSRRGTLGDSFNFNLPLSWLSGTIVLRFDTPGTPLECQETITPSAAPFSQDAVDCKIPMTFTQRNRPSVVFVAVPYVDGAGTTQTPTTANLVEQALRASSILPTDRVTFQLDTIAPFTSVPTDPAVNAALALKRTIDTAANCAVSCRSPIFRYYGLMIGNGGGLANNIPGQVASGWDSGSAPTNGAGYARNRGPHELGHVYGRHHAVDNTMPLINGAKQGQCAEQADAERPSTRPSRSSAGCGALCSAPSAPVRTTRYGGSTLATSPSPRFRSGWSIRGRRSS
jgi:Beta-propeller repeat